MALKTDARSSLRLPWKEKPNTPSTIVSTSLGTKDVNILGGRSFLLLRFSSFPVGKSVWTKTLLAIFRLSLAISKASLPLFPLPTKNNTLFPSIWGREISKAPFAALSINISSDKECLEIRSWSIFDEVERE